MTRPPEINPYAAPAASLSSDGRQGLGSFSLAGLATCAILASAVVGAVTNAINVRISPDYFVAIMGWKNIAHIPVLGVVQGIFEGTAIGMIFALLFVGGVVWITGAGCSFRFALVHLLAILAGALLAWSVGGVAGMALANLNPSGFACRSGVRRSPARR